MKIIIILSILTLLLFTAFLIFLIIGLIKKRKKLIIVSIFIFALSGGSAGYTAFSIAQKSVHRMSETLKSRTGEEIYTALFGNPVQDCVKIINQQDQEFPVIDYAIWIQFTTCPQELRRILEQHSYTTARQVTSDMEKDIPYGETIKWFNPKSMGDTILVFEYSSDNQRNIQTLWASIDSTIVYCRDIHE